MSAVSAVGVAVACGLWESVPTATRDGALGLIFNVELYGLCGADIHYHFSSIYRRYTVMNQTPRITHAVARPRSHVKRSHCTGSALAGTVPAAIIKPPNPVGIKAGSPTAQPRQQLRSPQQTAHTAPLTPHGACKLTCGLRWRRPLVQSALCLGTPTN